MSPARHDRVYLRNPHPPKKKTVRLVKAPDPVVTRWSGQQSLPPRRELNQDFHVVLSCPSNDTALCTMQINPYDMQVTENNTDWKPQQLRADGMPTCSSLQATQKVIIWVRRENDRLRTVLGTVTVPPSEQFTDCTCTSTQNQTQLSWQVSRPRSSDHWRANPR